MTDFSLIDQYKELLAAHRPLTADERRNLREVIAADLTYHSNAIEGSSMTPSETRIVLEGMTVKGKSMREHLEVVNHHRAIENVEELANRRLPLTESTIKRTHYWVLRTIDDSIAGKYRAIQVQVDGSEHVPPPPDGVADAMRALIAWHDSAISQLHPVERAARLHGRLVNIHPFEDGNGRTSRLVMNFELIKSGYPPAVIPITAKDQYYAALERGHLSGDYSPFVSFIESMARNSFGRHWRALGIDPSQIPANRGASLAPPAPQHQQEETGQC